MAVTTSSRPYRSLTFESPALSLPPLEPIRPDYVGPLTNASVSSPQRPLQQQQQSQGSGLSNALNSPLIAALISGAGGFLTQSGQNAQQEANRQMSNSQFNANLLQRQLENDQADQRTRALAAQQASPLGTEQNYAAKMALAQKLLGGLKDVHSTPGDPAIAAAMGSRTGGMHLPQFSPQELESLFGSATTQSSLAQNAKQIGQINPSGPVFDLSSIYGTDDSGTNPYMNDIKSANEGVLNKQMDQSAQTRQLIQQAMAEDAQTGKPGGSSIWKKIASIGMIAGGGIATALTGGAASPLLAAAIGAGTGAGVGALNGGAKGALTGAAMGGLTGGLAGGAGSAVKHVGIDAVKTGLKSAAPSALLTALQRGR